MFLCHFFLPLKQFRHSTHECRLSAEMAERIGAAFEHATVASVVAENNRRIQVGASMNRAVLENPDLLRQIMDLNNYSPDESVCAAIENLIMRVREQMNINL